MAMGKKRYTALATVSTDLEYEFDEDEVPEGMDVWEYVKDYVDGGDFTEVDHYYGHEWNLYDIVEEESDE
jgi:hypothetical protein